MKVSQNTIIVWLLGGALLLPLVAFQDAGSASKPAWVTKLVAAGADVPDDKEKWALELWSEHMGDLTLYFSVRPQALPNGTIRLTPYLGAGKAEQWWVDWPDAGSLVIRRTTLNDFSDGVAVPGSDG
jgi:hypothetical protein